MRFIAEEAVIPSRARVKLKELAQRHKASRSKGQVALASLRGKLGNEDTGLDRLYHAVETGVLAMDNTWRDRAPKL